MAQYKKSKKIKNPKEFDLLLAIGGLTFVYTRSVIKSFIVTFAAMVLIFIYIFVKHRNIRKKYLLSGIDLVDTFKGEEFEKFLLAHFQNLGYRGDTTPKSHDYGADLVLCKDNKKTVVQAKRWSSKVGIEAIQQIIGAKAYYKANNSIVITNNYFTSSAINLAESSDVELWDRKKLLEVMSRANGRNLISEILNINEIKERHLCKKCGSDMIIRNSKFGKFYGCSNYPKCKYTENIKE